MFQKTISMKLYPKSVQDIIQFIFSTFGIKLKTAYFQIPDYITVIGKEQTGRRCLYIYLQIIIMPINNSLRFQRRCV